MPELVANCPQCAAGNMTFDLRGVNRSLAMPGTCIGCERGQAQ
jgi:hypothetical protein